MKARKARRHFYLRKTTNLQKTSELEDSIKFPYFRRKSSFSQKSGTNVAQAINK